MNELWGDVRADAFTLKLALPRSLFVSGPVLLFSF